MNQYTNIQQYRNTFHKLAEKAETFGLKLNPDCLAKMGVDESLRLRIAAGIIRGIDFQNEHRCWTWNGGLSKNGYGDLRYGKPTRYVHRLIYIMSVGPLGDEQCSLHSCDDRRCCNPRHLFAGTQSDNISDMIAKGRRVGVAIGSANHNAVMNERLVRSAKKLRSKGMSFKQIAQRLRIRISQSNLVRAVNGVRWKHVS